MDSSQARQLQLGNGAVVAKLVEMARAAVPCGELAVDDAVQGGREDRFHDVLEDRAVELGVVGVAPAWSWPWWKKVVSLLV